MAPFFRSEYVYFRISPEVRTFIHKKTPAKKRAL